MSIQQTILVRSSMQRTPEPFLKTRFAIFSCEIGLTSKPKVIDYLCNLHATIARLAISYLTGQCYSRECQYFSKQVICLGKFQYCVSAYLLFLTKSIKFPKTRQYHSKLPFKCLTIQRQVWDLRRGLSVTSVLKSQNQIQESIAQI